MDEISEANRKTPSLEELFPKQKVPPQEWRKERSEETESIGSGEKEDILSGENTSTITQNPHSNTVETQTSIDHILPHILPSAHHSSSTPRTSTICKPYKLTKTNFNDPVGVKFSNNGKLKRPKSAFFFFMAEMREKVLGMYEHMKRQGRWKEGTPPPELPRLPFLYEEWRNLGSQIQNNYKEMARKAKAKYLDYISKYYPNGEVPKSLTHPQKCSIKDYEDEYNEECPGPNNFKKPMKTHLKHGGHHHHHRHHNHHNHHNSHNSQYHDEEYGFRGKTENNHTGHKKHHNRFTGESGNNKKWGNLNMRKRGKLGKKSNGGGAGPGGQKKCLNGYMIFVNRNRQAVINQQPGLRVTEIGSIMGKIWNKMSAEDKEVYNKESRENRLRQGIEYENQNNKYSQKRTQPDDSSTYNDESNYSESYNHELENSGTISEGFENVTYPMRPYMQFVRANRDTIKQQNPDLDAISLGKRMGEVWRNLTEVEKDIYRNKFKVEFERFKESRRYTKYESRYSRTKHGKRGRQEKEGMYEKNERRRRSSLSSDEEEGITIPERYDHHHKDHINRNMHMQKDMNEGTSNSSSSSPTGNNSPGSAHMEDDAHNLVASVLNNGIYNTITGGDTDIIDHTHNPLAI